MPRVRSGIPAIVAIVSLRRPAVAVMPAISFAPARGMSIVFCMVPGPGVYPVLTTMAVIPVALLSMFGARPVVPAAFSRAGQDNGAAACQGGAEK